jgi:hypothetical protein
MTQGARAASAAYALPSPLSDRPHVSICTSRSFAFQGVSHACQLTRQHSRFPRTSARQMSTPNVTVLKVTRGRNPGASVEPF